MLLVTSLAFAGLSAVLGVTAAARDREVVLQPVLRTPLVGGTDLAAIAPADRLAELDFELPLSGGDVPTAVQARLREVAGLLRQHLPPDDALAIAELLDAGVSAEARVSAVVPAFTCTSERE